MRSGSSNQSLILYPSTKSSAAMHDLYSIHAPNNEQKKAASGQSAIPNPAKIIRRRFLATLAEKPDRRFDDGVGVNDKPLSTGLEIEIENRNSNFA